VLATRSSALSALDGAIDRVVSARTALGDVQTSIRNGQSAVVDTRRALTDVQGTIASMQVSVREVQQLVAEAQRQLVRSTEAVTKVFVSTSAQLADVSAKLNTKVASVVAAVEQADVALTNAVDDVQAVVDANTAALSGLRELLAAAPAGPARDALQSAVEQLEARSAADAQLLQQLTTLDDDVGRVARSFGRAANGMNAAVRSNARSARRIRHVLVSTIPDVSRAVSAMATSAEAFSSSLETQSALVSEAVSLLTSLDEQLDDTQAALGALGRNAADVQEDLGSLRTDVAALSSAEILRQFQSLTRLKPKQIASFMSSPVQVSQRNLFPVDTYGSSMAPLFTNLALWIGAFMLVVLLKLEADGEGIDRLTVRQAYLGRWMLLALFNVFQALLVSIGVIVIGVQMASAPVFVATSVLIGLVYVSIIYSVTMAFGYIGKGMIILLVIMQIPGASGIYPIEMMPGFFRAIFPYLPFGYGIDAMRETIGGFYEAYYLRYIGVLLLFGALSFLLGMLLRQRLGNLARLLNRQLGATGLFVSENVQVLGSRRRLSQITQALTDRERFRERTAQQARWLGEHRVQLRQASLIVGVFLTVILLIVALLFPDEKATVLGLWGLVCLLVIGFLVALEAVQQNVRFAQVLGGTPDAELKDDLVREEEATHSSVVLSELPAEGQQP